MTHTPEPNIYHLPWEIKGGYIVNVKGVKVLEWLDNIILSRADHQDVDGRAFAELIICAVNSRVDLLKALEWLHEFVVQHHFTGNEGATEPNDLMIKMVNQASAAIALAKPITS